MTNDRPSVTKRHPNPAGRRDRWEGLFFGIGVGRYEDEGWETLEAAPEAVRAFEELLFDAGYATRLLLDPTRAEVVELFQERESLSETGFQSPVVIVWSGHGEAVDDELALITRDTSSGKGKKDTAYSPSSLVSFLFDSGSRDFLIVIDACAAGAASETVLTSFIRQVEQRTWPDREPTFGLAVSCKGYEKAKDGVFLTALFDLLKNGPDAHGAWDAMWSAQNAFIPLPVILLCLSETNSLERQHPRCWTSGSPKIRFPNPRYDRDARPGLVDTHLRNLRREEPAYDPIVATPAAQALIARCNENLPGLWVITGGPGTGKSSVLQFVSDHHQATVLFAASGGLRKITDLEASLSLDQVLLLDGIDEMSALEQEQLVQDVSSWARRRLVVVAVRSREVGDAAAWTGLLELRAEMTVNVQNVVWLGDAIATYVALRLREAN